MTKWPNNISFSSQFSYELDSIEFLYYLYPGFVILWKFVPCIFYTGVAGLSGCLSMWPRIMMTKTRLECQVFDQLRKVKVKFQAHYWPNERTCVMHQTTPITYCYSIDFGVGYYCVSSRFLSLDAFFSRESDPTITNVRPSVSSSVI